MRLSTAGKSLPLFSKSTMPAKRFSSAKSAKKGAVSASVAMPVGTITPALPPRRCRLGEKLSKKCVGVHIPSTASEAKRPPSSPDKSTNSLSSFGLSALGFEFDKGMRSAVHDSALPSSFAIAP